MLSLRGALLLAEARIADLRDDVRNLRRAMGDMRGSWTWRRPQDVLQVSTST